MSDKFYDLPEQLSVDPRLLVNSRKAININRGAASTILQVYTPNSISNNTLQWSPTLSSVESTIIDSYMFTETTVEVTVNSGATPTTLKDYLKNNFSLRQYPMNSVITSSNLSLNNQTFNCEPIKWVHQLSLYQNCMQCQATSQSLTPIMPDQSQQYDVLAGSLGSPLLDYATGKTQYAESRGSFNAGFVDQVPSTPTQWVFRAVIREPVLMPVLDYSPDVQREGLAYIQKFTLNYNLGNLQRMFSLDAATCPLVTGITVNILTSNLHQTHLTAPLQQLMPPVVVRGYQEVQVLETNNIASVNAGATSSIQSSPISLNQYPKKIFVYVSDIDFKQNAADGYKYTDSCMRIDSVNILFSTQQGLLSNFTSADLYNICASEGCSFSFQQYQFHTGSVICFDPVLLFNLKENESSGLLTKTNFSIKLNITNISNRNITPVIYTVSSNDTIMTTTSSAQVRLEQGYLSSQDILNAARLDAKPSDMGVNNIYGGSVGDWLRKALSFVKDKKLISRSIPYLASAVPALAPFAGPAQQIASQLGYGPGGRKVSRREISRASLRY